MFSEKSTELNKEENLKREKQRGSNLHVLKTFITSHLLVSWPVRQALDFKELANEAQCTESELVDEEE